MLQISKSKFLNIRLPLAIAGLLCLAGLWLLAEYLAGGAVFRQAVSLPQEYDYEITITSYLSGSSSSVEITSPPEQQEILRAMRALRYGGQTRSQIITPADAAYGLQIFCPDNTPAILTLTLTNGSRRPSDLQASGDNLKIANPQELYQLIGDAYKRQN